jgi:dihydrolipoamide dehydrogenase
MSSLPSETELLVVGAGPGGYVCGLRAAQQGRSVLLADADGIGGTCLNYGCIPSKALITAADQVDSVGHASDMGIYGDPYVDFSEFVEWKDGVVDRLTRGVEQLCTHRGVTFVEGHVTFDDDRQATVETASGTTTVSFDNAVIATGSRPQSIDGFDFETPQVMDSKAALARSTVPDRLLVVGGGYIGMELGTAFHKLGAEVTVVEMLDRILGGYDAELAAVVANRATDRGIDIEYGEVAREWSPTADGISVMTTDDTENSHSYRCDAVLVAVGRTPVTDSLGLDTLGLDTDEHGFLAVDSTGETATDGIYAVGDVTGGKMLAHEAMMEGAAVADCLAGETVDIEENLIPAVVFTDPEIATVGPSPAEAEEAGISTVVGRFPLSANGRALSRGDDEGFVRLVAEADSHQLIGAAVVGSEASELISAPTIAIEQGLTVAEFADPIRAHPTLSEAMKESAEDTFAIPTHWRGS